MSKKIFSKDYLINELDLPDSAIFDEITDNERWSIYHRCIFEDRGKFYEAEYSVGATESQDESPWEYDDNVKCTEVELKEVKVKKWVPVVTASDLGRGLRAKLNISDDASLLTSAEMETYCEAE